MKTLPESKINIMGMEDITNLEVIDFVDDIDFNEWMEDPMNEEYMGLLAYKILDTIFSESEVYKLNLFIAIVNDKPFVIYIQRNQFIESLDKLINFYSKFDEFELCNIFKEAKEIIIKRRG